MVFTGLIDAGRFWDNTRALAVATNFANWTDTTTKNLRQRNGSAKARPVKL